MPNLNYLYVEDDRLSRQVMEMLLTNMMNITSYAIFDDSQNFMARVEELDPQPDIFLLDIHMEPINGFEMLTLLREDPRYANSRIYALTASVMNEEVQQLKNAGFDGVIGKPLDADTFPELIAQLETGQHVWQIK